MMVPKGAQGSPLIKFMIKNIFYEYDKVVIPDMASDKLSP